MRTFAETPIEFLKGVGPKRGELLRNELGIYTFQDLLYHLPFRYVDRSKVYPISQVQDVNAFIQVRGRITDLNISGMARQQRLVAVLEDESGLLELVWFKGVRWISSQLQKGMEVVAFGKPNLFRNRYSIPHPEITSIQEFLESTPSAFQAVYSTTEKLKARGLDSRGIGKLLRTLFDTPGFEIRENLPDDMLQRLRLPGREASLRQIHFPQAAGQTEKAEKRLIFEELFLLQLWLVRHKLIRRETTPGIPFLKVGDFFHTFYDHHLPFTLTAAQKKVMREIRKDLGSGKQMNRLLQGDVGSGKTLVALMAMLLAMDNGCQSCMMAPTEILATQHYQTLQKFLEGLPLEVALLTGSSKTAERKVILEKLARGEKLILVGTHALIEDRVRFARLGLVIIDEQHRFGVEQRAGLLEKGKEAPHILVMTATPIPRSLAMTLYGHMDYSVIDELPPGRKSVKTFHFRDKDRLKVFHFMRQQIKEGRQIYVVYPLIHESETLDLKDLMDGYESIVREFPAPQYAVSIVHGQMKTPDKDFEMERFRKGETQIMVATTVIEVGVDIPNASVMVIENAERFGLSQLHQLRGRVGRGADQSYCLLMSSDKQTSEAKIRLQTMVESNDGFHIADVDMRLRGPGDVMGTRQSGDLNLRISDLVRDEKILKRARQEAIQILESDPLLEKPVHLRLQNALKEREQKSGIWSRVI